MTITLTSRGNWTKTRRYLKRLNDADYMKVLESAAEMGVAALAINTPVDSGLTASSWDYHITRSKSGVIIEWVNTNMASGWFNVAIALQYGHGTGTGGFVEGYDYINPAIRPVFDKIAYIVWEAVTSS